MKNFHLAQVNIVHAKAPVDSPLLKGFVDRLDEINAIADRQPGFVWRLVGDGNDATDVSWGEDPLIVVNMSVWQDVDSLFNYTYKTKHIELISKRHEWFHQLSTPYLAMWWVEAGHVPSISEAKERLQYLEANGPTPYAFTFKTRFEPPVPSN